MKTKFSREKQAYDMSREEFERGDWLKLLENDSDKDIEISYINRMNTLIISKYKNDEPKKFKPIKEVIR